MMNMMTTINCNVAHDDQQTVMVKMIKNSDDDIGHHNMDGDNHNNIMLIISRTNHNLGTANKNIVNIILG